MFNLGHYFFVAGNYSSYYTKPAHFGLLSGNDVSSNEQFAIENRRISSEMKENQKALNEIG
jgi:hypothetical protein